MHEGEVVKSVLKPFASTEIQDVILENRFPGG